MGWVVKREMGQSQSIRIILNIAAEEYKKIYLGAIRSVFAISTSGKSVRFPVSILQPFVAHDGVHGEFIIYFDDKGKFSKIVKL